MKIDICAPPNIPKRSPPTKHPILRYETWQCSNLMHLVREFSMPKWTGWMSRFATRKRRSAQQRQASRWLKIFHIDLELLCFLPTIFQSLTKFTHLCTLKDGSKWFRIFCIYGEIRTCANTKCWRDWRNHMASPIQDIQHPLNLYLLSHKVVDFFCRIQGGQKH